jgi:hypothetical protein
VNQLFGAQRDMKPDLLIRLGTDTIRAAANEPEQAPDARANFVTAKE